MAIKLHRCGAMWMKGPHPCWKVQKALDFHVGRVREVALVGDDVRALERVVRGRFRPHLVPVLIRQREVGRRGALLDQRTAMYRSSSQAVTWTRYSSHSLRFSST